MIQLNSTSDVLKMINGSTGTVDVQVYGVDIDASGAPTQIPQPYRLLSDITTAATNTIAAAPLTTFKRTIKTVAICNKHASASNLITVQHYDGTTTGQIVSITLLAGETLSYDEGRGWSVLTATGTIKQSLSASGRYIGTTLLTSASANFTTGANTNTIKIRGVGGGGAGAGCTSVASSAAGGGGGGAGSYVEKTFAVSPGTAYAYTCGALGAGASGALGGNGIDSTFVVGGTTVTAHGGGGAPVATAITTLQTFLGGVGGAISTNGDVNDIGEDGFPGLTLIVATPIALGAQGGSSPFGAGGRAKIVAGNGNNATGFGGGGGGSMTGASAVRTGGSGTAGCWYVDEYT